jgi:hypothetical protein
LKVGRQPDSGYIRRCKWSHRQHLNAQEILPSKLRSFAFCQNLDDAELRKIVQWETSSWQR